MTALASQVIDTCLFEVMHHRGDRPRGLRDADALEAVKSHPHEATLSLSMLPRAATFRNPGVIAQARASQLLTGASGD